MYLLNMQTLIEHVTVSQVLSTVIYIGTILGAITAIGAFVHFSIVRPLRKFLRKEIVSNLVEINESVGRLETKMMEHMRDPEAHEWERGGRAKTPRKNPQSHS